MPDSFELSRMYVDKYFEPSGSCRPTTPGGYLDKEDEIRAEARGLLSNIKDCNGELLEVGCAGGFFLDEARKAGFDVTGLEFNAGMAAHAREQLHLKVVNASVFEADFPAGSFDVVTVNRVLEHIPSLPEALAKISKWLRPGGILLVSGPFEQTTRAVLWHHINRLFRRPPLSVCEPPYHVHGFTAASWNALMRRAGFRLKRIIVTADSVHLKVRTWKDLVALPLEFTAWAIDHVRGCGSFMVSLAEVDGL